MGSISSNNVSLNTVKTEFGAAVPTMNDVFVAAQDNGNYHQQTMGPSNNSNLYTLISAVYGGGIDFPLGNFRNYNSDTEFMFQVDFNVTVPDFDIYFELFINDGITTPGTSFAGGGTYNNMSGPQNWAGPGGTPMEATYDPGGYYIWVECSATWTGTGRNPGMPVTFTVSVYQDLFPGGRTQIDPVDNVDGWDLNNTGSISQNGFYNTVALNSIPWNRCPYIIIDIT